MVFEKLLYYYIYVFALQAALSRGSMGRCESMVARYDVVEDAEERF